MKTSYFGTRLNLVKRIIRSIKIMLITLPTFRVNWKTMAALERLTRYQIGLDTDTRNVLIQDKLIIGSCTMRIKIMNLPEKHKRILYDKINRTLANMSLILSLRLVGSRKKIRAQNNIITPYEYQHYRTQLVEIAKNCRNADQFFKENPLEDQFKLPVYETSKHGYWKETYSAIDVVNNFTNVMIFYDKIAFSCKLRPFIQMICTEASNNEIINKYPDSFRFIVKKTLSKNLEANKITGLIGLYTIEEYCGYRSVDTSNYNQTEDLYNWFGSRLENAHAQVAYLRDNIRFLDYRDRVNEKSFIQTLIGNLNTYNRKSILAMYFADGVSADVKVNTYNYRKSKWKKMKTTKTLMFANMDANKVIRIYNGEYGLIPILDAKALHKLERYKIRFILSTDIHSFVLLTEMDVIFKLATRGMFGPYTAMSTKLKVALPSIFQYYLNYNATYGNRYLLIPLDYTAYDHTISKELIIESMHIIEKYGCDSVRSITARIREAFILYCDNLYVSYNDTRIKYNHGMLSGWKITNSCESFINYMTTRVVMSRVFSPSKIELITTMGDDMVAVIDAPGYENRLHDVLKLISDEYSKMGIEANPTKNSISYTFIEFLRVAYYPFFSLSYPTRAYNSLFYSKPTSSKQILDDAEIVQNINMTIWRNLQMAKRKYFVTQLLKVFTYKSNFDRKLFIKAVNNIASVDIQVVQVPISKLKIADNGFYYSITRHLLPSEIQHKYKDYLQRVLFTEYQTRIKFVDKKNDPRIKSTTKEAIFRFFDENIITSTTQIDEIIFIDYLFDRFLISEELNSCSKNKNILIKSIFRNMFNVISCTNISSYGIRLSFQATSIINNIIKSKFSYQMVLLIVRKEKIKTTQLFAAMPITIKCVKNIIDYMLTKWAHFNRYSYSNLRQLQVILYGSECIKDKVIEYANVLSQDIINERKLHTLVDVLQAIDG